MFSLAGASYLLMNMDLKNKSITFRLSAEEYEALKNYCVTKHMRSVSELARVAILERVHGPRILGDLSPIQSAVHDTVEALKNLGGRIAAAVNPSQ